MPTPLNDPGMMTQDAAYWPPDQISDGFGSSGYGQVQLIKCRWEDRKNIQRDDFGNEVVYDAVVFPNVAVQEGGLMALGDFSGQLDSSNNLDPATISEAKEIRNVNQHPELNGVTILYEAML